MSTTTHPARRVIAALTATLLVASLLVLASPVDVAGAAPVTTTLVVDDFEHGDAAGNGWYAFNGETGGGGFGMLTGDDVRPGGGTYALGVGAGGGPGFYAGFGKGTSLDLTGAESFSFWINPVADQTYTLEVNLQDDDNNDGVITQADDDEWQFNCEISPTGPCAVAGGGWQQVTIPISDFFDDGSFLFGGNGLFDPTPENGVLLNVVMVFVGPGGDANFSTDDWAFHVVDTGGPTEPGDGEVVQDFEVDLGEGAAPCPPGELPVGFCTFADANSNVSVTTEAYPVAPLRDGASEGARALRVDLDVVAFAGYIDGFGTPQDWSTREGVRFWFHGQNTGTTVFVDILENRNPEPSGDDAERYSASFVDDFSGWQQLEFPFSSFTRKEIGNGAPNDGFDRFEVHGFALGTLNTPQGGVTYWLDDVEVYGEGELPGVTVGFAQQVTRVEEGGTAQVAVKLNRALGPEDPAEVTVDYATERSYATPGEEFTPTSGTLTFVAGGPTEQTFAVETFDDTKFEGDEQIVTRLTNAVGAERSALFQGSVLITEDDPFDEKLLDDFVRGAFLWDAEDVNLQVVDVAAGETGARPEQDAVEEVLVVTVPEAAVISPLPGDGANLCRANGSPRPGETPVELLSTDTLDTTTIDLTTLTVGEARPSKVDRRTGEPRRIVDDFNGDGVDDLKFHFRFEDSGLDCDIETLPISAETYDGQQVTSGGSPAAFQRDFALGQDWTGTESLDFWFRGAGAGDEVTVTLKDNRATYDDGPDGWSLVWADEFDAGDGTVPDPANWSYEIGDTTPDAKNGWGNDELQYYTDDPDNAAMDGDGNLVITLNEADEGRECYYGPCEYESARLITQHKAEFAYGRIESRVLVPDGGAGLWPAFWSLGTDITYNPWPGAGEIDIMEYVSRLPNEIFGTVHGPGYQGGGSIGDIYTFDQPVYEADRADGTADGGYHTFTVEWEPDLIVWYVDGVEYHRVTPADLPGPWVFDKPFFLLLNFAVGGNFGGAPAEDLTVPQEFLVDYVRVYQGPDTAERFEASFTDDVAGWQRVSIPVSDFERSAVQPVGAPDDGLGLDEVWGYGFATPNGVQGGEIAIDMVERVPFPPPSEVVVTSDADDGEGSLRTALATVADGGTVILDGTLGGGTIELTSGELLIDRSVTIDGSAADGLVISAGGNSRVVQVAAGKVVTITDVEIADGRGLVTGGGVLNFGSLTLERVVVRDNLVPNTTGTNFDRGGGGIYTGDGGSLTLIESVVRDNTTENQPAGGVYSFFNSTTTIVDSTITGNRAGDVAGGIRTLGTFTLLNSTVSDNTSAVFHGGGVWVSDSDAVLIDGSLITGNAVDDGTAGGLMVFAFAGTTTATVQNSIIAANVGQQCQAQGGDGGGVATLISDGGNVFGDASCGAGPTDIVDPSWPPTP